MILNKKMLQDYMNIFLTTHRHELCQLSKNNSVRLKLECKGTIISNVTNVVIHTNILL